MPKPAAVVNPPTDSHDWRDGVKPGPRALRMWSTWPELFPSTVFVHLGPDFVPPPVRPYPRRRIAPREEP